MNDPLEQLREAAARFARTTGAQPSAPAQAEERPTPAIAPRAAADESREADDAAEKAAALAGTLTGRLGELPVRSVARLIRIFSQRQRLGASERRLIASALDYGMPWHVDSIAALSLELGVPARPGAAYAMWEQLRPSRIAPRAGTEMQVLESVMPEGRGRTVQSLLDACRSERLLISAYRTFQCALRLGAKPSYTAPEIMEQVAREMTVGRLEPFSVKQVLARLGHKTDELTVFETAVFVRATRDSERPAPIAADEIDLARIVDFLAGRRMSAENILGAVRDAYGFVITRQRARELALSLRSMKECYTISAATLTLIQNMVVRMPGLTGQDVIHRALLASMQSMVHAGTPGFPATLGDARYARMIMSNFNALSPAAPVVAPVIRGRSGPKKKAPTS
ncbi:hypothetical protein [Paraburkholderia youngii]|uniref:hypothetical protein n=1 Tax=Paraburkholderia youngii TaxID=2782701 RepID=UPI003D23B3EE